MTDIDPTTNKYKHDFVIYLDVLSLNFKGIPVVNGLMTNIYDSQLIWYDKINDVWTYD